MKNSNTLRPGLSLASIVLALFALFVVACGDKATPTEVPRVFAPTPVPPTPTPIPQPASMSGKITSYGQLLPGATVECQGKTTTVAADGTYALAGLLSGTTTATCRYSLMGSNGTIFSDSDTREVTLLPGVNVVNFIAM